MGANRCVLQELSNIKATVIWGDDGSIDIYNGLVIRKSDIKERKQQEGCLIERNHAVERILMFVLNDIAPYGDGL